MPDMDYLVVSALVHLLNDFSFIVQWQPISFTTLFILTGDVLVLPHSIALLEWPFMRVLVEFLAPQILCHI